MFVIVPAHFLGLGLIAAIIVGIIAIATKREPAQVVGYIVVAVLAAFILYFPINWGVQAYKYYKPLKEPTLPYPFKSDDRTGNIVEGIAMSEEEFANLRMHDPYWSEYFSLTGGPLRAKPVPRSVVTRTKVGLAEDRQERFEEEVAELRESCSLDRRAFEEYYYKNPKQRLCDFAMTYPAKK